MPSWVKSFAPGRINLIGEHTDYNDGLVMPGAIEQGTTFSIKRNETDDIIKVTSIQMGDSIECKFDELKPKGGWSDFILGTLSELIKLAPGKIKGIDCEFSGNVPIGAGMSSSASLGASFAFGINELFELGLSRPELAKIVQAGDHNFVGVRSGIMDQYISLNGKAGHFIELDCRDLTYELVPANFESCELLLINTNVSHSLADSAYNQRRAECEEAVEIAKAKFPNIKSLRDLEIENLMELINILPTKLFARVKHVVGENHRVQVVKNVTKEGTNLAQIGPFLYQSHQSLSQDYEVSCKELDFLVDASKAIPEVFGSRMMGGGFGGCTISLIKEGTKNLVMEKIFGGYKKVFGGDCTPYSVKLGAGACIVEKE